MDSLKIQITREAAEYRVSTSRDGNGWWGVGPTFAMWVGARSVAGAIASAAKMLRPGLEVEIIDETGHEGRAA